MNKKILILSSLSPKNPGVMKTFATTIKNKGSFCVTTYKNIALVLDAASKNSTIYVDGSVVNLAGVYFRVLSKYRSLALPLAQVLQDKGIPFVNSIVGAETFDGKVLDYSLLYKEFPIPKTLVAYPEWIVKNTTLIHKHLSFPYILKTANGKMGLDNYLVDDTTNLQVILKNYSDSELFCLQQFIPNECDYRIIVIGYKAKQIYSRTRDASSTSHLNNVTQGAKRADFTTESMPEICTLAEKAAKHLRRDICGVDIIVDSSRRNMYILEVNSSSPGLPYPSSHRLIGAFLETKFLSNK